MNCKTFMWHAKRGHGECFAAIKDNPSEFRGCVEKLFVTNYAFLLENEYRSSFAYELAHFYNDDLHFFQILLKKLTKTSFDNFYLTDYLLNNLYFILRSSKTINCSKEICKILVRHLKKEFFTVNESKSIQSLLSVIIDSKMDIDFESIIERHFCHFLKSNLDLSDFDYCYGLTLSQKRHYQVTIPLKEYKCEDILELFISNNLSDKEIYMLSKKMNPSHLNYLINTIKDDSTVSQIKANALKLIYYSNLKVESINILPILLYAKEVDIELKKMIYAILFNAKSGRNSMSFDNVGDCFWICEALKKNSKIDYPEIHKRLKRLRINYCDSDLWFEVESSLIYYFKSKNADIRFLTDIKTFMKKGLCSTSRYDLVRILKKYGKLTNQEMNFLTYDANYRTRNLFKQKHR